MHGENDDEEGEAVSSETEVDESLYGKGGMISGFASGIPKVESESRVASSLLQSRLNLTI